MSEKNGNRRKGGSLRRRTGRAVFTLFLSIVLILSDIPAALLVSILGKDNSIVKEIDGLRAVKAAPSKLIVYGQNIDPSGTVNIVVGGNTYGVYKNGVLNILRSYSGAGFDVDTDGDTYPDINTCIYAEGNLIIELGTSESIREVTATINNTKASSKELYGIYVRGNLTVVNATANLTRAKKMTLNVKCSGTATEQSAGIYADSFAMPENEHMKADEVTVSANGAEVEIQEPAFDALRVSYGICAENSYVQGTGKVWAVGGNISGDPKVNTRNSYGLFTKDLILTGGSLNAMGGDISGPASGGSEILQSIGIGIAFRDGILADSLEIVERDDLGNMQISGGSIVATGGTVTKEDAQTATSVGCVSNAENCSFSDCQLRFKGGDLGGELRTNSKGFYATENVTMHRDAKITALTGSHGEANYHIAFTCREKLDVYGGTIDAYSTGGVLTSTGIELGSLYIRKESNASIKAEAERTLLGETEGNNKNKCYGIVVGAIAGAVDPLFIIEEDSGAEITAIASREHGTHGMPNCGGIYLFCPADIASGKIYAELKGSNKLTTMRGGALLFYAGDTNNVLNISGGEIILKAEGGNSEYADKCVVGGLMLINQNMGISSAPVSISGGTLKIDAKGDNAAGIYNACADSCSFTYELQGEELLINSEWKAVDDSNHTGILDCSIVKDGDDALDESVFSMSEFEDSTGFRAVSGTKAAPAVADILRMHHYEAEGELPVNESFADVMPEDAGEVRYVAGEAKAETEAGEASVATVINSFTVNSTSGAVNANLTLSAASLDDVVTLPVSIRSEGYKPVSANVIVMITDKAVTDVNINGDSEKTYGDPVFQLTAAPVNAGTDPVITWSSRNTSVAEIDADGNVTIKAAGATVIRADYISDEYAGSGNLALTVCPKTLNISGLGAENKVYDGTTDAVVTGMPVIEDVLEADHDKLGLVSGTARFTDKNAGTNKNVVFSGYKLTAGESGDAGANYVLEQPASVKADITPKGVTATVTAVDREYEKDKLTVALTAGTLSGVIDGDTVSVDITEAVGTMADDEVGEDKVVTVTGVKLAGADAANYTLSSQPTGITVSIIAHEHDWGEWTVVKEATTTETGLKRRVCKLDATHIEEEVIPKKSETNPTDPEDPTDPENPTDPKPEHKHTMIRHEAVAATEEAEGNIEYWECSECKKLFKDAEGKTEISLKDTVIPKLPDPRTVLLKKQTDVLTENINGKPVSISLNIVYPEAVSWTGAKITKAQLEALSGDDGIVKVNLNGLEEALKGKMKEGADLSKLISISLSISKDKNAGTKGYFTLKAKLNTKAVKKAKIKGADKKALAELVKKLNEQIKDIKYEYEIVPIKLAEAESISIKAKLKKGALQLDDQGKLKGLKSVKIKVKIKGLKKAKSFSYNARKAKDLFKISITDAAAKTAVIEALPGTGFRGSSSVITITK